MVRIIFFSLLVLCYMTQAHSLSNTRPLDDEQAIKQIHTKLKTTPYDPSLLFLMGWYMQKKNLTKRAEEYYLKCIQIQPDHSPALINLGNLYSRDNKWDQAEKYYLQALQHHPNSYQIHYNVGVFYLQSKAYDKALSSFLTTIRLNTKHKKSYVNIAMLYLKKYSATHQKDYIVLTQNILDKGLTLDKTYPHFYYHLGTLYELQSIYQLALKNYQQAMRYYSNQSAFYKKAQKKIANISHLQATSQP